MSFTTALKGQRVLVTGASQGIGFGAAKAFVEEGARVVINSSHEDRLGRAVAELAPLGDVRGVVADLTQKVDLERLVAEAVGVLGGLDTVVYVTGGPPPGAFLEQEYEAWARAANLLVVSPAYLCRLVARAMTGNPAGGRIVLLSSFVAREPSPNLATSSSLRIALNAMVRTLARELGPSGIRVNAILPGWIDTARVGEVLGDMSRRAGISEAEARQRIAHEIPLGRIGRTDELARAILFLGSDLSSYISGAVLPVDGGLLRSAG